MPKAKPKKKAPLKPTAVIPAPKADPAETNSAVAEQTTVDQLDHIVAEVGASIVQFTLAYTGNDYKAKLDLVTGDLAVGRGPTVALAVHRVTQKAKVFYGAFAKRGK